MATNPFSPEFIAVVGKILTPVLQDIVVAVVILLLGLIIGRILGRVVERLIVAFNINKVFRKATGMRTTFAEMAGTFVTYVAYFITIVITLNLLKATPIVIYAICGILVFVIVVSLILSIKDFIPNMFSGFYISRKGLLRVGDIVKFKDIEGRITEIGMIGTKIVTEQKDLFFIPNSVLTKSEVLKIRRKKTTSKKN